MSSASSYHAGGSGGSNSAARYSQPFTASTLVQVAHGLGYQPIIAVLDSQGRLINATVTYPDPNNFSVEFNLPLSGTIVYQ